jgi:hypothetical protein
MSQNPQYPQYSSIATSSQAVPRQGGASSVTVDHTIGHPVRNRLSISLHLPEICCKSMSKLRSHTPHGRRYVSIWLRVKLLIWLSRGMVLRTRRHWQENRSEAKHTRWCLPPCNPQLFLPPLLAQHHAFKFIANSRFQSRELLEGVRLHPTRTPKVSGGFL